jgi:hypothetical protein
LRQVSLGEIRRYAHLIAHDLSQIHVSLLEVG